MHRLPFIWLLLLPLLWLGASPSAVHADPTGIMATCPADSFGYTCRDSNEPNGPAFNWIDISGTGTNMGLLDESHFFPITLPFTFDFYGTPRTEVAVGSNGTVYFQGTTMSFSNLVIPSAVTTPSSFIAVYWDDLNPSIAPGAIYYEIRGTAPQRYLVVQYQNVINFGTADPITAQAILFEGTNNILVQYLNPSLEAGVGATTGIQGDATTGLQYSFNTASLTPNLAICYQHPSAATNCEQEVVWDGGGADNNWSTAANWIGDQLPTSTDTVVFNSTSAKDALVDGAFAGTVAGLIVQPTYTGTITQASPLTISGDYRHRGGTMIVSEVTPLTVGNALTHTGGTLQQTRVVNNTYALFLQINNGAVANRYRGVELDTTGNGNNLGAVTVRIRRVDGINSFCTQDGAGSPAYALRCFEITPTNNLAADSVRLWVHTSEQNGIAEANLRPYRNPDADAVWTLMGVTGTGNDGGAFVYTQAPTPGFSHFLVGDSNAPTAVTNLLTQATSQTPTTILALLATLLAAFSGVRLWRRR